MVKSRQNAIKTWEEGKPNTLRETTGSALFLGLFYLRRIIFATTLVYLRGFVTIQLISLMLPTLAVIATIAGFKPLIGMFSNRLELYNNCCTMILAYSLCCMTEYVEGAKARNIIAWVILALTLQFFNVNLYIVAVSPIRYLKDHWRRIFAKKLR